VNNAVGIMRQTTDCKTQLYRLYAKLTTC